MLAVFARQCVAAAVLRSRVLELEVLGTDAGVSRANASDEVFAHSLLESAPVAVYYTDSRAI